jgi:hypothetical protein
MMKWIGIFLLLSLAAGLLSACAAAPNINEAENPAVTAESGAAPTPRQGVVPVSSETPGEAPAEAPVQSADYGEEAAPLVKQAQEDLAQRLGAPIDQISVVSVSEVVWPDGSLGCPQPGQMYTQATMPGYQITLSYQGQEYNYHTDMQRAFLCENPVSGGFVDKKNLVPELRLVNMAIADLAQRLGIDKSLIIPQPLVAKRWPDTSLGCPDPGQTYTPADKAGYEIMLKVKQQGGQEQTYIYHSDLERIVFCEQ